jgi:hypothetical protein
MFGRSKGSSTGAAAADACFSMGSEVESAGEEALGRLVDAYSVFAKSLRRRKR